MVKHFQLPAIIIKTKTSHFGKLSIELGTSHTEGSCLLGKALGFCQDIIKITILVFMFSTHICIKI